jgi:hypothetical protein
MHLSTVGARQRVGNDKRRWQRRFPGTGSSRDSSRHADLPGLFENRLCLVILQSPTTRRNTGVHGCLIITGEVFEISKRILAGVSYDETRRSSEHR